ncbi:PREDICTED: von Willebrand factor-like [Dufourea novaeangliae]|uniref:von Willebrand factor-like n=1 Tax=Dufourea novaeangliae TaxID=178035 RepID=UPI0007670702|nr:PREDICTED: von Willebrand factor-like [Dufourea novaeangliae]
MSRLLLLSFALVATLFISTDAECPENEVWNECGSACPLTCDDLWNPEPRMCIALCIPRCVCVDDFVRNDNGNCIPKNKCRKSCRPKPITLFSKSCSSDFSRCSVSLLDGMLEIFRKLPLHSLEVPCNKPAESRCQAFTEGAYAGCPKNEVWNQCGTACPLTCEDVRNPKPKPCTKQCVPGCYCIDDLVRSDQWKCIPRDKCRKPCKPKA